MQVMSSLYNVSILMIQTPSANHWSTSRVWALESKVHSSVPGVYLLNFRGCPPAPFWLKFEKTLGDNSPGEVPMMRPICWSSPLFGEKEWFCVLYTEYWTCHFSPVRGWGGFVNKNCENSSSAHCHTGAQPTQPWDPFTDYGKGDGGILLGALRRRECMYDEPGGTEVWERPHCGEHVWNSLTCTMVPDSVFLQA